MAKKTNPTGIRFDLEKVAFIKQREKLNSNQQVVDFLMNKYWWEWKVPNPTYKESPPLELRQTKVEPIKDEPLSFDKLKEQMNSTNPQSDFYSKLDKAKDLEELERIGLQIQKSGLGWKEKLNLKNYGQRIAQDKFV